MIKITVRENYISLWFMNYYQYLKEFQIKASVFKKYTDV
jgi:hypothetical protein